MRRPPFPQVKQPEQPGSLPVPGQKPAEPTTTTGDQNASVETAPVNGARQPVPVRATVTRDRPVTARPFLQRQLKALLLVLLLLLLLSLLVAWTLSPNLLAITGMGTPESGPGQPPQMEVSLAGPVSREETGAFTVPIHLTLAGESDPWPQEPDSNDVLVAVGDRDGTRLKPLSVVTLSGSARPFSRTLQVTLPPSLHDEEVTLTVTVGHSEARLRLSLGGPPAFAIRPPEPDTRASIDEDGVLSVAVDGAIDEKTDNYRYEWTLVVEDADGTVKESTLAGAAGKLKVQLAPDRLCADYTIRLVATGEDGRLTWSQPGRACRRSGEGAVLEEGE